jgi:hypothetical protein
MEPRRADLAFIEPRRGDLPAARRRLHDVFIRAGEIRMFRAIISLGLLCVGLAVAVAVPLAVPSLSSSGVSAAPPPRDAPVTQPFPTGDVAPASGTEWWALGTAQSCAKHSLCVAHTADGAHYTLLSGPPTAFANGTATSVGRLTFASDGKHGYAWGPGLWATADGGGSWSPVPGVDVVDLVSGTSEAYMLVKGCPPTSSCPVAVDTLTMATSGPQLAQVPESPVAAGSSPTAVAALGNVLWVAYANGAIVNVTADPGTVLPEGCPSGAPVQLVAVDSANLVVLCPSSGGVFRAYELTESGAVQVRDTGLSGQPTAPLAAVADDVCLGAPSGGLACTAGPSVVPPPPSQVTSVAEAQGALFAVVGPPGPGTLQRRLPGEAWVAAPVNLPSP